MLTSHWRWCCGCVLQVQLLLWAGSRAVSCQRGLPASQGSAHAGQRQLQAGRNGSSSCRGPPQREQLPGSQHKLPAVYRQQLAVQAGAAGTQRPAAGTPAQPAGWAWLPRCRVPWRLAQRQAASGQQSTWSGCGGSSSSSCRRERCRAVWWWWIAWWQRSKQGSPDRVRGSGSPSKGRKGATHRGWAH